MFCSILSCSRMCMKFSHCWRMIICSSMCFSARLVIGQKLQSPPLLQYVNKQWSWRKYLLISVITPAIAKSIYIDKTHQHTIIYRLSTTCLIYQKYFSLSLIAIPKYQVCIFFTWLVSLSAVVCNLLHWSQLRALTLTSVLLITINRLIIHLSVHNSSDREI